ncbi:hypothetical protein ONZ45_g17680 [Pleurotus djamor]|nr:hypothetical protein ONZ45_g17680 [Pleurotus djamor]
MLAQKLLVLAASIAFVAAQDSSAPATTTGTATPPTTTDGIPACVLTCSLQAGQTAGSPTQHALAVQQTTSKQLLKNAFSVNAHPKSNKLLSVSKLLSAVVKVRRHRFIYLYPCVPDTLKFSLVTISLKCHP